MKYLFTLLSVVFLFSSCLKDTKIYRDYPIVTDFQAYQMTKDSIYFGVENKDGFAYYDLAFFHKLNSDKSKVEGGFSLSNMVGRLEISEKLPISKFRVYEKGTNKNNVYAVYQINDDPSKMPLHDVSFLNQQYGTCHVHGCYIANSEAVVKQIKSVFEDGDSLTVLAKGYLKNKLVATHKKNLAKFSVAKDSIVSKWTVFEFPGFSNVDCIDFEMTSTKSGVDKIFCMDNMVANIHLEY